MELRVTESAPLAQKAVAANQPTAHQAGVFGVDTDVEQAIQQASSLSGDASVFSNSFGSIGTTLANQPVATAATLGAVRGFADHNTTNLATETVSDIFSEKFLKWGLRDSVARTFDTMFHGNSNHKAKSLERQFTYSKMVGLDDSVKNITFSDLGKGYIDKVKSNFSQSGKKANLKPTINSYLKHTVYENNINPIKYIFDNNEKGIKKLSFGGLGQAFGLGLMGIDVARSTKKAHDESVANGDNSAETAIKTASTMTAKTTKSILSWEIAGAVFQVASKAMPTLGAIAVGALAASIFTKGANKIAPTP